MSTLWMQVEASDRCQRCSTPIAALPKENALCCRCRYGVGADSGEGVGKGDCVEWLQRPVGVRLLEGFRELRRAEV